MTLFLDQESGNNLTRRSGPPIDCHRGVGQGCGPLLEDLPSSPTGASPKCCIITGSWFPPEASNQEGRRAWRPQPFHNPLSKVAPRYFCHALFLKSRSINPAHSQGKEITHGCEFQETGVLADHLRGCSWQRLLLSRLYFCYFYFTLYLKQYHSSTRSRLKEKENPPLHSWSLS